MAISAFRARTSLAFSAGGLPGFKHVRCSMQSAAPAKSLDLPALKTGCVRVVLIRHGAVDLTTPGMTFPKDCFYGGHDVPLSDYGKLEAQVG
eukprot:753813-Hanusia_phi.AAC.2